MATRERAIDRGRRRGRYLRIEIGRELREGRLAAGLSQAVVGRSVGINGSTVGRIERAEITGVSIQRVAELSSVVGQELGARGYPSGPPARDAAHLALLARARVRIGGGWRWQPEVPVGGAGDLRAWDAVLERGELRIGLDAETRLRDIQALVRRIESKLRDGGVERVILVIADTRGNRAAIAAAGPILGDIFAAAPRAALVALRADRDPGAHLLLLV